MRGGDCESRQEGCRGHEKLPDEAPGEAVRSADWILDNTPDNDGTSLMTRATVTDPLLTWGSHPRSPIHNPTCRLHLMASTSLNPTIDGLGRKSFP